MVIPRNGVDRFERFKAICETVYSNTGNYALMKGNRFCGFPFMGIWKTKDDNMVFGSAYVIYMQMDNPLMRWVPYTLSSGKVVNIPEYDNQELVWEAGVY